jgi:hypothetical protein
MPQASCERHYKAKLTRAQVIKARKLRRDGLSAGLIAQRYPQVGTHTVHDAIVGISWRNLTEEPPVLPGEVRTIHFAHKKNAAPVCRLCGRSRSAHAQYGLCRACRISAGGMHRVRIRPSAQWMRQVFPTLPQREQRIVCMRYGLREFPFPSTLKLIGQRFGITRERVRQILKEIGAPNA